MEVVMAVAGLEVDVSDGLEEDDILQHEELNV